MLKKVSLFTVFVLFVAIACVATQVIAQEATVTEGPTKSISASGVLVLPSSLDVICDGGLTFTAEEGNLSVMAPEVVEVRFNGGGSDFQSIIVSCDNPNYTGKLNGDGLVGHLNPSISVPLFWTVFADQAKANSYVFDESKTDETTGEEVADTIDPTYQPYLLNKTPLEMNTGERSYASCIWDIEGGAAKLGDAPYSASGNHETGNPRTVSDGVAYLRFAADFHGGTAQQYSTIVNFTMITIS